MTLRGIFVFLRSALTGAAATVVDLAVLVLAMGFFGATARAANVPALLAGAVIQFAGNRHFAFAAGDGPLGRQLALFGVVEAGALGLNALAYDWVARQATLDPVGAVALRLLVGAAVFVGFSFPLWQRVFAYSGKSQKSPSSSAG